MGHSDEKIGSFTKIGAVPIKSEQRNCSVHGGYVAHQIYDGWWSGCEKCMVENDRRLHAHRFALEERERKERVWKQRLGRAAIPERFSDRTLESYAPTCKGGSIALEKARNYAENWEENLKRGRSLIFSGMLGTGKTHLAIGIAKVFLENGKQPVFISLIKAIRLIKSTYGNRSDRGLSEAQAIAQFVDPDLLILDEVGVQFNSETERMCLFEIVNERYEQSKPTIFLSNLTLKEMSEVVGERIMDRMRENGGSAVIFDWESHRSVAS